MFYVRKSKKGCKYTYSIMCFRKREELFEHCKYVSQSHDEQPSQHWNINKMLDFLNKHDDVYHHVRIDAASAAKELKGF